MIYEKSAHGRPSMPEINRRADWNMLNLRSMNSSVSSSRSTGGRARNPNAVFVTTQWSVVLTAARSDTTRAQEALEKLCQIYWYPLYAYVRRRGHSAEDAQDLTQAFFARLLEKHWVEGADRERGRFRTFLLTAMSRFLSDEWDRKRAQKRGGAAVHVPVQMDTAETRYGIEPADDRTPEQIYERNWAVTLLENVLHALRAEYEHEGNGGIFAKLSGCLAGARESQPYSELASQLEMNEGAVKVAVHRLRKRYRKLLRAEISQTLADGEDTDEELRHLMSILGGK